MAKTGRNDPCPCGSKRKFKNCCASKRDSTRQSQLLMIVIGAVIVLGVAVGVASFNSDGGGTRSGKVWDPVHGHVH